MKRVVDFLPCAVSSALENGYYFISGISGSNVVKGGFIAGVYLFSYYGHYISCFAGANEGNVHIERHAEYALGVAGESEGTVGSGEDDTTMHDVKTIEHIGPYSVMQPAITLSVFIDDYAQPFAEVIFIQHGG